MGRTKKEYSSEISQKLTRQSWQSSFCLHKSGSTSECQVGRRCGMFVLLFSPLLLLVRPRLYPPPLLRSSFLLSFPFKSSFRQLTTAFFLNHDFFFLVFTLVASKYWYRATNHGINSLSLLPSHSPSLFFFLLSDLWSRCLS